MILNLHLCWVGNFRAHVHARALANHKPWRAHVAGWHLSRSPHCRPEHRLRHHLESRSGAKRRPFPSSLPFWPSIGGQPACLSRSWRGSNFRLALAQSMFSLRSPAPPVWGHGEGAAAGLSCCGNSYVRNGWWEMLNDLQFEWAKSPRIRVWTIM